MKKAAVIVCIGVLVLGSCRKEESAAFIPNDYDTWARMNQEELDYPVPGHESNYRIIYINEKGGSVTVEEREGRIRYSYPEGTVIAKEIYPGLDPEPGTKPVMVTAMAKQPGHENAYGGWVWVVKHLESGDEQVMQQEFCFTCHSAANEEHPYADENPEEEFRDYVFFAAE
jgi:hypothetical protein